MKILVVLLVVAFAGCSTEKAEVKNTADTTKNEIVETRIMVCESPNITADSD